MKKFSIAALALAALNAAGVAQAQFQDRTFRMSNGVGKDHPMGHGTTRMNACTLEKSGG